MAKKNITISGYIFSQKKKGIANLKVEAWDKDMLLDDLVGSAVTDDKGKFVITFTSKYFKELFLDRKPDLFFRIFQNDKLIHSTEKNVIWNMEVDNIDIEIYVDIESDDLSESPAYELPIEENVQTDTNVPLRDGSSFQLNPNLFKKKLAEIKFFPVEEKETINNLLNLALKERLLEVAGESKGSLEKVFKKIKFSYEGGLGLNLNEYFTKFILPEAKNQKLPEAEITAIQNVFDSKQGIRVNDILQLDSPLKDNLIIGKEFRKMQTLEFGKIAGLKADKLEKLTENDFDWDEINDASLYPLVKDGTLTESEKDDLLVTSNLTRLPGDNLSLIQVLKTPQLKTLEDFVSWENEDWIRLIKDNKITLPDEEDSVESYAENIRQNIEKTFPTQYFFKRIVKDKYYEEFKLLNTVEKLQPNNKKIIEGTSVNAGKLDWKDISSESRIEMEKDLSALSDFSNTYRHLGIPEIINDEKLDKINKANAIEKRLNSLKKFLDSNPNLDLYYTDLLGKNNGLNWQGIDPEDQKPVKSQLLAYQRVQTLSDNYKISESLLKIGMDSALSVAGMQEEEFVKKSGLDYQAGRTAYHNAKDTASVTANYF